MQIALNGLQNKHSLPYEFPYKAINPMTTKEETFNSKEDVYLVLEECYNKCIEKGYSRLGEALYKQSLFIANDIMFIDSKYQDKLKAYKFCKKFNCPPYPSLQDTPIEIIDIFNIIDQEIEQFSSKEK